MQVHPDIAALRGDHAPQRAAQAAYNEARLAWMKEPGAKVMLDELQAYGAGAALTDLPVLDDMFLGQGTAERLIGSLTQAYCATMAAHPHGHPPFRNGFDGNLSSILLARSGRAQLLLQSREPGEMQARGHVFSDASRFDAVLAGEAEARIVRITETHEGRAQFDHEHLRLRAGNRLALDLDSEALEIDRVHKRMVVLRLLRAADEPEPGREFCATSGRLLYQSAATSAASRQETIIALLGRMGRTDAAPAMAQVALTGSDVSLRWQAVREALALDTATGFAALVTIARAADDPLARQAGALRAQLLETYPDLAKLETAPCRA